MAHSYSRRRGLETSQTCILSFLDIVIKKYYGKIACVCVCVCVCVYLRENLLSAWGAVPAEFTELSMPGRKQF